MQQNDAYLESVIYHKGRAQVLHMTAANQAPANLWMVKGEHRPRDPIPCTHGQLLWRIVAGSVLKLKGKGKKSGVERGWMGPADPT